MPDNQLLENLDPPAPHKQAIFEQLKKSQITTYSQLFAVLQDETADIELRQSLCMALIFLSQKVDKRRAVGPLMQALKSDHFTLYSAACRALGSLQSKRALPYLTANLTNREHALAVRTEALYALSLYPRTPPAFRDIIHDETEHLSLRSTALEWVSPADLPLTAVIDFLSHTSADMRFWAAYRLTQIWDDIAPALDRIDQVADFDRALPDYWGWHVGREALYALETIYFRKIILNNVVENFTSPSVHIISPAAEYETFIRKYRTYQEDSSYLTQPEAEISPFIESDWLAARLGEDWPDIKLNIRQPKPKTYALDWYLVIDDKALIGGLHRDGYAIVLTGDLTAIRAFATWYRRIIQDEQILYLYEWAGEGIELTPGISIEALTP